MSPAKLLGLKKQLWLVLYAREAFRDARNSGEFIQENIKTTPHKMFSPLTTAMTVSYARPFTNCKGVGGLPAKYSRFPGADLKKLHDSLIHTRNSVYAHSDASQYYYSSDDSKVAPLMQVHLKVEEISETHLAIDPHLVQLHLQLSTIPHVVELAKFQISRLEEDFKILAPQLARELKLGPGTHRIDVME